MEGPDQILPLRHVHPRLAADGGVDHRHQTRGNLDQWNPPHEGGGHESGQVPRHSTPQGHDRGVTAESGPEHQVGEASPFFSSLGCLSGRKGEEVSLLSRSFKPLDQLHAVEPPDPFVREDGIPVSSGMGRDHLR